MAEATPTKRVLPARERRESAAKRYSPAPPTITRKRTASKLATPVKPATPATVERATRKASKRAARTPTPPVVPTPPPEDILPTKVISSRPLPTTKQKQAGNLSSTDYQSIAESAILAASLHRSRMQWLSAGIFKRYWVKPVKRKGVLEQPPNNPDAKSMTKLGVATMTVEPHKFDVTFYTVKEQGPLPVPQYSQPKQSTPKTPSVPYAPPVPHPAQKAATPTNVGIAPPPTAANPPVPQPTNIIKQEPAASPVTAGHPPVQQTIKSTAPTPKTNSDPVIQMLAARAATDQHLKDLMKVVATSKANAEQLKEFQKHIDEFNAVVKEDAERLERERQTTSETRATPVQASPQTAATPTAPTSAPAQPTPTAAVPSPTPVNTPVTNTPGAAHPSVYNTTAPRPPPPAWPTFTPPRPVEAYIKHIVFEFHGEHATTDRFLFPAYAALDMKHGGLDMLASFFVERQGSDVISSLGDSSIEEVAAAQARWKAEVEYYQPVTIMVRANQHKTIETIARAAKTLPEVQEYMKQVLANKTRAPAEFLVHQLPREKGVAGSEIPSADAVDSGVEMGSDDDDEQREDDQLKSFYGNV